MLVPSLLLCLPLLGLVQGQNQTRTQSPSGVLTTSFSTGISLGPNRQPVTFTQSFVFTTTAPTPAPGSNNTTNGTVSANQTSTSTTQKPLPTAPTNVDGGGAGPNGAPSPGATAPGGIYGPGDGYISKAEGLVVGALAMLGSLICGAVLLL